MSDTAEPLPSWIAADWGTSNLRVWQMGRDGAVLAHSKTPKGMGALEPAEFEPALLQAIGGRLRDTPPTPVVVCGMAGARQGWCEAPYAAVPAHPQQAGRAVRVETEDKRLRVFILPGLKQSAPPDVMRGEECQIAGLLAAEPGFDGVVCLPGTHTKWAHVSAGEVVSFRTFMTGEVFSLLTEKSILRHATVGAGWDATAFDEGLADAMTRPAAFAGELFALRAMSLLQARDPARLRARLSGLLIGIELAAARPYWLGQDVRVIGDSDVCAAYLRALQGQGVMVASKPASEMTLQGLTAAYRSLQETVE